MKLSEMEKRQLKHKLLDACKLILENRAEAAGSAMKAAQDSANNEDKSSAGDKYETARAMGQQDRDMFAKQLEEAGKDLAGLRNINPDKLLSSVSKGAIVLCRDFNFFISAGLGTTLIDDNKYILLSPAAPLTKALQEKKKGDSFNFNGKTFTIEDVF